MKNKVLNILFAAALSFGCTAALAKVAFNQAKEPVVEQAEAAEGTYYSGISDSLTGTSLLNALHTLNSQKRQKTIGYGSHRQYFQYTERCASTPSGKMVGFYNNDLVSATWDNQATWNHEHIWPNSRGGGSNNKGGLTSPFIDADIHMVRPAAKSVNEGRGNLMYAASGAYDPGQYVAEYRGIAARIIFYCAIADTRLTLTENINDSSANSTMGKLSDLLKWNLQYAPSTSSTASVALQVEQNRNEVIYSRSGLQGNRNPFIDHPEYACRIWGDTNATTRQICGSQPVTSTVTLNKSSATIEVGKSTTLTATSSNGGNITWTTNNTNVTLSTSSTASGSSVKVLGAAQGSTIITAKNADGATATCTITINKATQTEKILLDKTSIQLAVGEETTLTATTNDGSNVEFEFEEVAFKILNFSDFQAASGEPFKLEGLKDGTTTITVTSSNGGTATCVVTVGTGQYEEESEKQDDKNKKSNNVNLPLIIGLGGGGGVILIAGLIVLIVLLTKKKPV